MILIESLPEETKPHGHIEYVLLDWDMRRKARQKCVTDHGTEVAIALPRGLQLIDGTVIYNSPERTIVIKANSENVIKLRPKDLAQACRVAHHAGNWHRCLQVTESGELVLEEDAPIKHWLEQNQIVFAVAQLPFQPNLRSDAHD
jgi:urease accessory protein